MRTKTMLMIALVVACVGMSGCAKGEDSTPTVTPTSISVEKEKIAAKSTLERYFDLTYRQGKPLEALDIACGTQKYYLYLFSHADRDEYMTDEIIELEEAEIVPDPVEMPQAVIKLTEPTQEYKGKTIRHNIAYYTLYKDEGVWKVCEQHDKHPLH